MEILHLSVLILHVLGATLIIGSIFTLVLMLRAKSFSKESMAFMEVVGRTTGGILIIQLLTGIYLIASESDKMGNNPLVWTKFLLFILAGLLVIPALRNHKKMLGTDGVPSDELVRMWRNNTYLRFGIFLVIAILGVIVAELAK